MQGHILEQAGTCRDTYLSKQGHDEHDEHDEHAGHDEHDEHAGHDERSTITSGRSKFFAPRDATRIRLTPKKSKTLKSVPYGNKKKVLTAWAGYGLLLEH